MARNTAITTALLALLTGLVLGQLGPLALSRPQSATFVSTVSAQDLATARSFYDGVNRFLTSDDRAIASMLAFDFVDHTDALPNERNAEQLLAGWTATRSLLPHLRLTVVDVQVVGTVIAVRLEVDPGVVPAFPGIPLAAPAARSVVEFLRIRNSMVAERWSGDDRLPGMAMTLHADFVRKGPNMSGPTIERISLSAGESVAFSGDDTVVLQVTSGTLLLDRAGIDIDSRGAVHPSSDPLAAGQIRVVEVKDTLVLRNRTDTATEFLASSLYGLYPVTGAPSGNATAVAAPAVSITALAYMPLLLTDLPGDRLRLTVTEVTLPAGASMAAHTPGLVEEIVVLDGALEATVQTGRALVSAGNGQAQPFDGIETASAGQGFSASSIATLSYRVASAQPAALLIMTIEPVR
jgi:hypothetical protein